MPMPDGDVPWQFDHLGLVVASLDKGRRSIARGLRVENWTTPLTDHVNGAHIQFGRDIAGMVYELLEPTGPESPLYNALRTRTAILNHVAYRVPDLAAGAERLRSGGFGPTGAPTPAVAYGGAMIQFFVSSSRFIVELIEAIDAVHVFDYLSSPDEVHRNA